MASIKERAPHQQRVIAEHRDLAYNVDKLKTFSAGDVFKALPSVEQGLLNSQLIYMKAYLLVLDQRISLFDKEHA